MNVKPIHVKMEEFVWMESTRILANVLGIMMVQLVVIVLHGILDVCVKYLKAQVSSQIYLYHPLQN